MGSRLAGAGLLLCLAFPPVATGQPSVLSPGYRAAVERYVSGDHDGAVAAVAALAERELRQSVEALLTLGTRARACGARACGDSIAWQSAPVAAALMLHTDSAVAQRPDGAAIRLHESLAVELAQAMTADPMRAGFARRWYRVMAELALGESRWSDALTWAGRGLDAFPRTAELLLVEGAIEEGLSGARGREARQRLERALGVLRKAVAADPELHEARLRLGRVAWRLGEVSEARSAFEAVLSQTRSHDTAFLAHLFRGRLDEDAGSWEDAVRAYEAALALDARSQSARIALSHARLRLGDPEAARREVERALAAAPRGAGRDAFWVYPWGPSAGVEERLLALRLEASS